MGPHMDFPFSYRAKSLQGQGDVPTQNPSHHPPFWAIQTSETLKLPAQMALAGLWMLEGVHSPRFEDDLKGQLFVEWEGM